MVFYDPVRLSQDLEEDAKFGHPCIAEPGMIVIPEITMERMNQAVAILVAEGYFSNLQPMKLNGEINAVSTFNWPPKK